MPNRRSEPFRWRRDVRNWLASVFEYQRRFGRDIRSAAVHEGENFPTNILIEFVGRTIDKGLAIWAVKNALRDAAASLSIPLNDDTLDFMVNLAVDAVLASS